MMRPDMLAAMSALHMALDEMTAPYVPEGEEVALLESALAKLIAAYELRDFAPGEEAVWNCGSITIGGEDKGAWEIHLIPTAAPSPDRSPQGEKPRALSSREPDKAPKGT